jgi:hypothetical protein
MRIALLTTVAAVSLSLSLAAVAQTGGSSGPQGSQPLRPPAASGNTNTDTSASGSASTQQGQGAATPQQQQGQGTASSGQSRQQNQGAASSGQQQNQGTASSGQQQNQGTASSTQQRQGQSAGSTSTTTSGAATTTGSTNVNVNLSSEQRTRVVQTLRSVNIQPVRENISISVGQTLPTSVTQLYDCPETLVSLITGIRECKVVLVNDRYYIVDASSRRVVTVIEQRG